MKNYENTTNENNFTEATLFNVNEVTGNQPNEPKTEDALTTSELSASKLKQMQRNFSKGIKCQTCNSSDKGSLLACYTCKKLKCKSCAEKESKYVVTKKRDQSSFICIDCINGQTNKVRPRTVSENMFAEIDMFEDELNPISLTNRKRTRQWEDNVSDISGTNKSTKDILDIDELHQFSKPPVIERKSLGVRSNRTKINVCHHCGKSNSKYEKCLQKCCGLTFCVKCIEMYPGEEFNDCFVCQKLCRCEHCIKINEHLNNSKLIKIDDFIIYEKDEEDELEVKNLNLNNRPQSVVVTAQEANPTLKNNTDNHQGTMPQLCLICKMVKSNVIVFKSLDEFVSYLKYFFDRSNIEAKYSNSRKEFTDYFSNYTKFYKNCEYIFKTNRIICEECFTLQLTKSFYDLFNSLRIGKHIILNPNASTKAVRKESEVESPSLVEPQAINQNEKNDRGAKDNSNTTNPFVPNNLINLSNIFLKDPNTFNSDLNVTNIVMNLDKSKNHCNLNSQMNSLVEGLKKQFFNLQYYSLLQKLFLSYIFKTMSNYIEKANDNHILSEFVLNNIINHLPKSPDSPEVAKLCKELTDQVNILKGVSHRSIGLTNALSSNFDELQNNGIKIFKAVELGRGSETVVPDNDFVGTMDLIKKCLNINATNNMNTYNNATFPPTNHNTMENLVKNFNLFQSFKNSNEKNPFASLFSNLPSSIGGSIGGSLLSSLINSGMSKSINSNVQGNPPNLNFSQQLNMNTNPSQVPPFSIQNSFQGFESLFKNKTEINNDILNFTKNINEMLQTGQASLNSNNYINNGSSLFPIQLSLKPNISESLKQSFNEGNKMINSNSKNSKEDDIEVRDNKDFIK